ncbi:MAG: hypothetical protein IKS51_04095 [Erysipelotrichaceae bacterium]|nr:hypothetical protein [Erysipelotrichaceae bacterium]
MISGIKQKFIDILFERDPDQPQEQPVVDITTEPEEVVRNFDAKDVLYKTKSSAFINLEETIEEVQKEDDTPRDYQFSQQISPMFGVVRNENDTNRVVVQKQEKDETMVNKPDDSHLDIVTSPFFGYGQNYVIRQQEDRIKEDGYSYDQDDPYMQGLYEHPDIPYDENEEPVDEEMNLFDDYEDRR